VIRFEKLNKIEMDALKEVSKTLGIQPEWLYAVINFESKWNPQSSSEYGSAKGLLQWTNIGVKSKGLEKYKFEDSADLIKRYRTKLDQIRFPVKDYLAHYAPWSNEYEFYMTTLAPKYKDWNPIKPLPEFIQKNNPGIKTPLHYVNRIRKANDLAEIDARNFTREA
jgi:hypothetical protein